MKKVVVNDTNIFIDLINMGLLEEFFSLPWEVHTTELVLLELSREGQCETIQQYKENAQLHVPTFDPEEMRNIVGLLPSNRKKSDVSIVDRSVWYYAKKNGFVLLTGDRELRIVSESDNVEVHDIIYVIDCIIDAGLMTANEAASKLQQLKSINYRLPKEAFEKRLKLWGPNKRWRTKPMI